MNERMKNESFYKKLISLCIPFMCKGLTVSVVGILNSIVLGTISTELMSALTLALNVQTVLAIFVGSSSTGLGILTAQYMGKGDKAWYLTQEQPYWMQLFLQLSVKISREPMAIALHRM